MQLQLSEGFFVCRRNLILGTACVWYTCEVGSIGCTFPAQSASHMLVEVVFMSLWATDSCRNHVPPS